MRYSDIRTLVAILTIALPTLAFSSVENTASREHAPLIIAHRGASGYLPEHSLEAYALAYAMGVDYIEPDVVLSKDGVPICSHDITLEQTTDVESVYPDRSRADGSWYVADFTAEELRSLQRRTRSGPSPSGHSIATLREMLDLVEHLNRVTGRDVGVAPEMKKPAFHSDEGLPLAEAVIATLDESSLGTPARPTYLQCFNHDTLRRIASRRSESLHFIALEGSEPLTDAQLREIATFADVVSTHWRVIEHDDGRPDDPAFIARARNAGLGVILYTFKADSARLRRFIHDHRVDGMFVDYPDIAMRAADRQPVLRPRADR